MCVACGLHNFIHSLRKAQALATEFNKPFVTVHHLEAHCLVARLAGLVIENDNPGLQRQELAAPPKVEYPFLALIASGGHTSLMICKGMGEYDVLGGTLDDALGEAFDKAARLLGLRTSGSGGAAVEALARKGSIVPGLLKVPMRDRPSYDFSYAGI